MTGRWFPLPRATDAEMDRFLRDARFRFEHRVEIPVSPSTVWEVLTADDALTSWATGITGADWTSPLGVGATRTVTVGRGAAALKEEFYRWDLNSRMTFRVTAANRPGITRFAEDLALTQTATGTRLTWTFAVDAAFWMAPLLAISRPLIGRVTGDWVAGVHDKALQGRH